MHCLYIDIASHDGLIAICSDEHVISQKPCDHKIGDHELIPLLNEALHAANSTYKDLTNVACVIGPGGFTSLRIGVACANVLADQLQIPVAGIHLSDVWRARTQEEKFLWVHSTKKEELFARTFGNGPWPEPAHLSLHDFLQDAPKLPWCGELIDDHRKLIEEKGWSRVDNFKIEPDSWLPEFLKIQTYENKPLAPWYGRGW